jgi:hypothetical protein
MAEQLFAAQKRSTSITSYPFAAERQRQRVRSLGIIASEDDCIFAAAETSKYSLANFHPSIQQPAALRNCSFSTEARRPFRLLLGLFIHRTRKTLGASLSAVAVLVFRGRDVRFGGRSSPRSCGRWKKCARLIGGKVGCYR